MRNPKEFTLFEVDPESQYAPPPDEPPALPFGKRMERFLSHALRYSGRYTVLAENVQIIHQGITLGELDFILYDRQRQQAVHLELACKFYLLVPGNPVRWVGPNHKDRLDLKLARLANHQLPLLKHPATQARLRELNITGGNMRSELHLTGQLHIPFDKNKTPVPASINPEAIKGFWIPFPRFGGVKFERAEYAMPEKQNWLTAPKDEKYWYPYPETKARLQSSLARNKSAHVWMRESTGHYSRWFIVGW